MTLAVAAFLYSLVAVMIGLAAAYGLRLRQGVGAVVLGVGGAVLGLGALLALPGLERALTTINDQIAIVPLGLSRILGLTVHLGIPTALPMWLLTAGASWGCSASLRRRGGGGNQASRWVELNSMAVENCPGSTRRGWGRGSQVRTTRRPVARVMAT